MISDYLTQDDICRYALYTFSGHVEKFQTSHVEFNVVSVEKYPDLITDQEVRRLNSIYVIDLCT